jgi:hypothetical protein
MTGVFQFVEEYFIRDLQSMRKIQSSDGLGRCGFQMMVTLCTGCELLGSIEKNDLSENSEKKFSFFLTQHLPNYSQSWRILFHFMRNRIAHDFITPPHIAIELKGEREQHLGVRGEWFIIDVYVFMDDFLQAYEKIKNRYYADSDFKKLMDKGYELLVEKLKDKTINLDLIISQSGLKHLPDPEIPRNSEGEFITVPSGAAFDPDQQNFTRIPDDMLEKINMRVEDIRLSGASGSTVRGEDIRPLKRD